MNNIERPKMRPGTIEIEIEGVGEFDIDKIPKYAFLQQKITMWLCIILFPCMIFIVMFSLIFKM